MNSIRRLITAAITSISFPVRVGAQSRTAPDEAGKQLRQMILGITAKDLGVTPSPDFPRVIGAVMDWPVGDQVATVVALSDGTASLYTTSTFGIIGGQAHESVRAAGRRFLSSAERHYDESRPTLDHSYPAQDKIAFYLLCYDGLRLLTADLAQTQAGTGKHAGLFSAAQEVLTQLRATSGK